MEDERRVPAALCAIASALEEVGELEETLGRVNWGEAGLTPEWFDRWWAQHKAEDARRRTLEAEMRESARVLREVLGKLTPAERSALGYV